MKPAAKQSAQTASHRSLPGPSAGRLRPIAGRHNVRLKDLRQAFRRAELTSEGECAIEGVKLVEEALRHAQKVVAVFFSESARPLAEKLLPQIGERTETLILPDALFKSIVSSETPQGIAALVKLQSVSSEQLLERSDKSPANGPLLVVAGLQDPGNLGTIMRSAEAFGAAGIFLTEGTVSPYNTKVLRGSAGSIFRLPFVQLATAKLIPLLKTRKIRLLATSSHKGTPLAEANWTPPLAIFIGNEGAGLPREILHQMDETLVIPQSEPVESLNAGVAASIVLYEAARRKVESQKSD